MRFEDLEAVERKIIPDSVDEVNLLRVALSRNSKGLLVSDIGPRVGKALNARISSHALLGMRQLAVRQAVKTGEYMADPNAVPVLHDKMTQEDLEKIVVLADARVQDLTGVPE